MENRDHMDVIHVKTNVIKRNGQEVSFDISKIINAIGKANKEVESIHQMMNSRSAPWRMTLPGRLLPTPMR